MSCKRCSWRPGLPPVAPFAASFDECLPCQNRHHRRRDAVAARVGDEDTEVVLVRPREPVRSPPERIERRVMNPQLTSGQSGGDCGKHQRFCSAPPPSCSGSVPHPRTINARLPDAIPACARQRFDSNDWPVAPRAAGSLQSRRVCHLRLRANAAPAAAPCWRPLLPSRHRDESCTDKATSIRGRAIGKPSPDVQPGAENRVP